MKPVFIYGLVDPREPNKFRYIGQTENLKKRLYEHCHSRLGFKRTKWVFSLLAEGLKPEMILLEETIKEHRREREKYWITKHFEHLTNVNEMPIPANSFPKLKDAVERTERTLISEVLSHTGFNLQRSAQILGISRPTIYDKMSQYGFR